MTDEENQKHQKEYKDLSEKQKQKRRDDQKQYMENITDEQKQKIKDYRKKYYGKYYIEKKLAEKDTEKKIKMFKHFCRI